MPKTNQRRLRVPGPSVSGPARDRIACWSVCAAALVAGWLTLGDMQRLNHADSLIPAFASLYRWTWFYWGQNRFGMLTALLATPIHHPLMNLLFQNWMVSFCGLLVFPLVHAYLLGWRTAPLSGLVGAAIFLLLVSGSFHLDYLLDSQPYAVSTCLGLLGLMAIASGFGRFRPAFSWASATMLLFLAFWVSLAAVFLMVPLFTLQSFIGPGQDSKRGKRLLTGLSILLAAGLANWEIAINYPYSGDFGWTPPETWPGNCASLLSDIYKVTPPEFLMALLALTGTGAVLWLVCRDRQHRREMLCACAICVLTALSYFTIVAATDHARRSGFPYRYAIPSIVLLVISAAMLATLAADRLPSRWRAGLRAALLLGLLVGTTLRYGTPSYGRVRSSIDQRFGGPTNAILDAHCTHVLGDYWDVWGSIFHANLALYESGSQMVIWGITARSEVTRDLWFPLLKGGRVAVVRSENSERDWQKVARIYQIPELKLAGELPQIRIFVPMW